MNKNILFLIIVIGLLTACGGRSSNQASNSDLQISVEAGSMEVGQTNLMVTVQDSSGTAINDATVSIKGDMSHAGMQPVLGETSAAENGVYMIPYEWTMAGDWFVTVDVSLSDGTAASERFDFTGIGGEMSEMDHGEMDHSDMDMEEDS